MNREAGPLRHRRDHPPHRRRGPPRDHRRAGSERSATVAAFASSALRRQDRSADRGRAARGRGTRRSRASRRPGRALCGRYVALLARELERPAARHHGHARRTPAARPAGGEPGVVLGLLTGNVAEGAALKLRAGGIDPARFRVGAYGSRLRPPARAAAHRRRAAPRALRPRATRRRGGHHRRYAGRRRLRRRHRGARAIAVATGSYSESDLAACGPWAVFPDLSDTARVLAAILE